MAREHWKVEDVYGPSNGGIMLDIVGTDPEDKHTVWFPHVVLVKYLQYLRNATQQDMIGLDDEG